MIKKKNQYIGLSKFNTYIVDNTDNSLNYFNIISMPNEFSAGKNVIRILANKNNLVKGSQIHVEVLDYNGDPVYYEIPNYIDEGKSYSDSLYSELKSLGKFSVWKKLKENLFKKEGIRCWICGAENAKFQATGCAGAFVSGSALCNLIKDKTLEEAEKISIEDIITYLNGLPKPKIHCACLAKTTLEKAIQKYKKDKINNTGDRA